MNLDAKSKTSTINNLIKYVQSFLKPSISRMFCGLMVDLLIREVVLLLGQTLLELTVPLFSQELESISTSTDELCM